MNERLKALLSGLVLLSVGLHSFDENELNNRDTKVFENLYVDGYSDFRKIEVKIESITYYMTTKKVDKDILNIFRKFSNIMGNSNIGTTINPLQDFESHRSFKNNSSCKKYFKATDSDKIIYEDKLTNSCFDIPVTNVNSVINIMDFIIKYIEDKDKESLENQITKQGFINQLSKYEIFEKHRDIFDDLIDYILERI